MATAKQNNLLVPLIVFVVLWVVTGVTAFLFYQKTTKLDSELTNAKKTAEDANRNRATAEANIKKLKELIGYSEAEFGTEQDAPGGTSLISKIKEDLSKFVEPGTPASFSYKDELARLAQRRDDLDKELASKTDNYNQLRAEFEAKRKVEEGKIGEHDTNFQQANADRETVQKDVEQKLAENRRQMEDREQQAQQLAAQKQQTANEFEKFRNRSEIDKTKLVQQVSAFRESVQKVQASGAPVGSVVSVDNLNNEVYIDRGSDDLLPRHTTFSVWAADQRGSFFWQEKNEKIKSDAKKELDQSGGRNNLSPRLEGGPKAYIEVLDILGPHQAKCRITLEKYTDPITPGDKLFTPLWAPGKKKHFALAGSFDMTGRKTNDRRLLIDMIKRQGGEVDAEVRDDGTLDGAIEVGTDYLVLGSLGDETESPDAQKEHAARIRATTDDLRKEAKALGIEVIDQNKLYDFMGYKPFSRKYEPGGFTGGPEPKNRFDNPSQSTQPTGLPSFENPAATTRPTGIPGKSSKAK